MKFLLKDDRVFEFSEDIADEDYLYNIILEDCEILISKYAVSIFCDHGESGAYITNITPYSLFPKDQLDREELVHIMTILEETGYEGKFLSKEELIDISHEQNDDWINL
ncbi:MAG: hypothetical protein DWQ19_09020 [Crenarchaeota archaeon]|nr:MAG: hypothetical protein DWQ19_09020 [Thermoproteota archaeon]